MRAFPSDRIGRGYRPKRTRRRKKSGKKTLEWLGRRILALAVLLLVLSLLMVVPLRWIDPPTTAFMLQDRSGQRPLQHEWVIWENLGDALAIAVVASEDQKFATHKGFDVASIRDSVEEYADGEGLRGASTITQQLAKNLFLWPGRSFLRKGLEAYFAVLLEISLSKQRILEIYLNVAEFGPGVYGAGAATKTYFGKSPYALRDSEAALLAAVLPNPKRLRAAEPSEYVLERQSWIIGQMERLRRERWVTGAFGRP